MSNEIVLDRDIQDILKGKEYYKEFRKICKEKDAYRFYNWRENMENKIKIVVNGDERKLIAVEDMLRCLCEKDKLNKMERGLVEFVISTLTVLVPVAICTIQIFNNFLENLGELGISQNMVATEVISVWKDAFSISMVYIAGVVAFFLMLLWSVNRAQSFFDQCLITEKLYNQELLEIVKNIELRESGHTNG